MYGRSVTLFISCLKVFIPLAIFLASPNTFSHGGGLDANGGHNDRKLDIYHCHRDYCKPRVLSEKISYKKTGYNRKSWRHWVDEDHDCQNTRAEILIASSLENVTYRNSKACSVYSGKWYDPYSNKVWTLASDVDIDHIVPLAWAYAHGANDWSLQKKSNFANDAENLIAVEDNLNQAKGAKGPSQWLPPNKAFRCEYVKRFDGVVRSYGLIYNATEIITMARYLAACGTR